MFEVGLFIIMIALLFVLILLPQRVRHSVMTAIDIILILSVIWFFIYLACKRLGWVT